MTLIDALKSYINREGKDNCKLLTGSELLLASLRRAGEG